MKRKFGILVLLALGLFFIYQGLFVKYDWRTADRSSARIAPLPSEEKEAVVLVFAARTFGIRGFVAVHSWIATKEKNADYYETYQVASFYLRRTGSAVMIQKDIPDRRWFGNEPELVQMLVGEKAERAIPAIRKAVKSYPYADRYVMWPGPNSNSFISYIIRQVPELTVGLPPNAIGKDYLGSTTFWAKTESGTGWQFSLWGLLGFAVGKVEGIEIDILGLNFGIDFKRPALKLPFAGRIGVRA